MDGELSMVKKSDTEKEAFQAVLRHFGNYAVMGRTLGISRQAVRRWEERGIPVRRVLEIEKLTNVSRTRLRPDVYPPS